MTQAVVAPASVVEAAVAVEKQGAYRKTSRTSCRRDSGCCKRNKLASFPFLDPRESSLYAGF